MTDFQKTTEADVLATMDGARKRSYVFNWRLVAAIVVLVFVVGATVGRVGYIEWHRQKNALRLMRNTVEQSLAPGEVVVVDDPLLGWALRRGSDGVLRQSVWSVREDGPVSSLLARLRQAKTSEIVVVATPGDEFIQHLDVAGFSVAQEVGWVPWDLQGDGWDLLGRARKRIFFAVVPETDPRR